MAKMERVKMTAERTVVDEFLRENGINRSDVKTKNVVLDKDNIDELILLDNRRDIKTGVKNSLKKLLMRGENFDTPLMCSLRKGKFRILDGSHRREALKEFFDKYPSRKVEVIIHYYEGLTDDEEKEKYTKWNLGTKQSVNDMVQQYWSDISIVQMLERTFPCGVKHKWAKNTIEFKTLVACYLSRNEDATSDTWTGSDRSSPTEFINKCKNLTTEDYKVLKAFMIDYIEVFGQPEKDATFYKQVVFWDMFKIWFDNKSRFSHNKVLSRWNKQLKGDAYIKENCKLGGSTTNLRLMRGILLSRLNAGASKNKYV